MGLLNSTTRCVLYEVEEVTTDPNYVDKHMNQVGEVIKLPREEFKNVQSQYSDNSGSLENRCGKICAKLVLLRKELYRKPNAMLVSFWKTLKSQFREGINYSTGQLKKSKPDAR